MAEPLKNYFKDDTYLKLADEISAVYKEFNRAEFIILCQQGFTQLELMPRIKHIAHCLAKVLPQDYPQALAILLASAGEIPVSSADPDDDSLSRDSEAVDYNPIASFYYLAHSYFVAFYGLGHFELSMQAQHSLTQRCSCEFSMRSFIEKYPQQSLMQLAKWAEDKNAHVRRLVSECTRPRLPWGGFLRQFQHDAMPVIALLEKLKDDGSQYVRRSVANNLNDIGKDNPQVLIDTCRDWQQGADVNRHWIIKHALRSAIKRAEPEAFVLLGFADAASFSSKGVCLSSKVVVIGEQLQLSFKLHNKQPVEQKAIIDLALHFVKANGQTSAKVFKLKHVNLSSNETMTLTKKLSFKPMTTRKLYPGVHRLDLIINGQSQYLAEFELKA